jgi:hypothetical protein
MVLHKIMKQISYLKYIVMQVTRAKYRHRIFTYYTIPLKLLVPLQLRMRLGVMKSWVV